MSLPNTGAPSSCLDPSVIPKATHIPLLQPDQPGRGAQPQPQGEVQKVTYTNIRVNSVEEIQ